MISLATTYEYSLNVTYFAKLFCLGNKNTAIINASFKLHMNTVSVVKDRTLEYKIACVNGYVTILKFGYTTGIRH